MIATNGHHPSTPGTMATLLDASTLESLAAEIRRLVRSDRSGIARADR